MQLTARSRKDAVHSDFTLSSELSSTTMAPLRGIPSALHNLHHQSTSRFTTAPARTHALQLVKHPNSSRNSQAPAEIAQERHSLQFELSGTACTQASYAPSSCTGLHYHEDSNLVLVLSGSLKHRMCSRSTALGTSSVLYVPAGELHDTNFGSDGTSCFFIGIDDTWVKGRLDGLDSGSLPPAIMPEGGTLRPLVLKIYQEFVNPDSVSDLIVEGALLELIARWQRQGTGRNRKPPAWLESVRTILHDSFRESLSLNHLAAEVGIHPSHIAREFHNTYRLTIGEYIRQLRIAFVADQLCGPLIQGSLTQLALLAGFSSHAHMCSVFKRVLGMTPTEYKRVHGNSAIG